MDTIYLVEREDGIKCTIPMQYLFRQISLLDSSAIDDLSLIQSCLISQITPESITNEPKTWKQALRTPEVEKWKQAFKEEMSGLEDRGVFSIVDPPEGRNIIDTIIVPKVKIGRAHV